MKHEQILINLNQIKSKKVPTNIKKKIFLYSALRERKKYTI